MLRNKVQFTDGGYVSGLWIRYEVNFKANY